MRLSQVEIKAYRGLQEVILDNISDLNIIVGKNNTGKTSVLEAIRMVDGRNPVEKLLDISMERESRRDRMMNDSLQMLELEMSFNYAMSENRVEINYKTDDDDIRIFVNGEKMRKAVEEIENISPIQRRHIISRYEDKVVECYKGNMEYISSSEVLKNDYTLTPFSYRPYYSSRVNNHLENTNWCRYISPLEIYNGRFGEPYLTTMEERQEIIQLLQIFDERIIGYDKGDGRMRSKLYIEQEKVGLVPSFVFGDGVKRIFVLANALYRAKNGILLIDEFEIGIHKDAMERVASWLAAAAKRNNTQIFVTTHSAEAVEAFMRAKIEDTSVFAYRLEHFNDLTVIRHYDYRELDRMINDLGTTVL